MNMPPKPKKESERAWRRQLIELGRAAGDNAGKILTANDIRADGISTTIWAFQRVKGHMCGTERTSWFEPCQLGWESEAVAGMHDLSAYFSPSLVNTRFESGARSTSEWHARKSRIHSAQSCNGDVARWSCSSACVLVCISPHDSFCCRQDHTRLGCDGTLKALNTQLSHCGRSTVS